MCGRFARGYTWKEVQEWLRLSSPIDAEQLAFSYNVAPTQLSPIVRMSDSGARELIAARWGLVPSWADDPAIGNRLINARADTVASKPAFRSAFKNRRCLVPISGFYEWQKVRESTSPTVPVRNQQATLFGAHEEPTPAASKRRNAKPPTKQPWYISPAKGGIMCLAGLWEQNDRGEKPLITFTIITTEANELVQPIHDRMPVILDPDRFDQWLNQNSSPEELQKLLVPAPISMLKTHMISPRVNSPRNDDSSLIAESLT